MSHRDIRRAIESGALTRLRRGWYAVRGVHPAVMDAGKSGGRLSCVSALHLHGAWVLDQRVPHVRVSSGVSVGHVPGIRVHWTPNRVGPGVDGVEASLAVAVGCLNLRALVVVADSLVNRRVLSIARLTTCLGATAQGRSALARLDPAAESGIETLVRLELRRLGIHLRSQVVIPDVGRVDFLIGERLILEADGYEWHADPVAFERDRERDRELVRRGYVVIRASYRQVMDDLDNVVLAVRDVLRRRDHHWRAVHRSQLSEFGYLVDVSSMNSRIPES